jgi:hypothetical protein
MIPYTVMTVRSAMKAQFFAVFGETSVYLSVTLEQVALA